MTESQVDVFGGVDTHRDVHVAAVVDSTGRVLGTAPFAADTAGYEQLGDWLRSQGRVVRVGIEGTGSYGAGLARHLTSIGMEAVEVNRGLSNCLCEGVGSWVFIGLGLVGWGSGFRVGLGLFSSRGCRCRGFLLVCW